MQQQLLNNMTDIPPQIQSKIAMVTSALEQFMTMDPDALESSWNDCQSDDADAEDETVSSVEREGSFGDEEKQFSTIEEEEVVDGEEEEDVEDNFEHIEMENLSLSSTRENSYSFEDLAMAEDERKTRNSSNEDEESVCESIKSDEMSEEKRKKNEKIQTLQKSWQKLCENQKTIHK